jgi:hypothetical protein
MFTAPTILGATAGQKQQTVPCLRLDKMHGHDCSSRRHALLVWRAHAPSTPTCTHTHTHAYTQTISTHIPHLHTLVHILLHTDTHTHARTHACACTHTQTHIHTRTLARASRALHPRGTPEHRHPRMDLLRFACSHDGEAGHPPTSELCPALLLTCCQHGRPMP